MPPAQITQSGLGANSQAAASSSRDRRPWVVKRQTKPTTQRDVTGMLGVVAAALPLAFPSPGVMLVTVRPAIPGMMTC